MDAADRSSRRSRLAWLGWLLAVAGAVATWGAITRLQHVDRRAHLAIDAARDEAAEHRAARFAAEAEVRRLQLENQRLAQKLAHPDAGVAPASTSGDAGAR
jgi:hypothetical protein